MKGEWMRVSHKWSVAEMVTVCCRNGLSPKRPRTFLTIGRCFGGKPFRRQAVSVTHWVDTFKLLSDGSAAPPRSVDSQVCRDSRCYPSTQETDSRKLLLSAAEADLGVSNDKVSGGLSFFTNPLTVVRSYIGQQVISMSISAITTLIWQQRRNGTVRFDDEAVTLS
jgi:hypothetical protein